MNEPLEVDREHIDTIERLAKKTLEQCRNYHKGQDFSLHRLQSAIHGMDYESWCITNKRAAADQETKA